MERNEALAVLAKVKKVFVYMGSGHIKATKESVYALIKGPYWDHKLTELEGMPGYAVLENVD